MKKILSAGLFAAGLLASTGSIASAAEGDIFYNGRFTCGSNSFATDWVVGKDLSGAMIAKVIWKREGSNNFEWLELKEDRSPEGQNVLRDLGGNIRLSVQDGDGRVRAMWQQGAPGGRCEPFDVVKALPMKDRFDELLVLLDVPEPKAPEAVEVARQLELPPNPFALPELDQQAYQDRFNTALPVFWARYRAGLIRDLASLPIADEAQRSSYVSMMQQAFGDLLMSSIGDVRWREGRNEMTLALRQASDRLADAGHPLAAAVDVADASAFCQRLDLLGRINRGSVNFRDLELVTRIAFDYWTRNYAEGVIRSARSCPDTEYLVRDVVSGWAEIQRNQEQTTAVKAERDRLLELPLTMATLIESENLTPDQDRLQFRIDSELSSRFFGANLAARRTELLDAGLAEIKAFSTSYTSEAAGGFKAISEACDKLAYLNGVDDEGRSRSKATCEAAMTDVTAKQVELGRKSIEAAFATAQPLAESAESARKTCRDLSSDTMTYDAVNALRSVCEEAEKVLETKEVAQRCTNSIAASGADDDLLDATIVVLDYGTDNRAKVRELVCAAGERGAQISFRSEGMMMWSKQFMTIKGKTEDDVTTLELGADENGADWVPSAWEVRSPRIPDGMKMEVLTACIMRTNGCFR